MKLKSFAVVTLLISHFVVVVSVLVFLLNQPTQVSSSFPGPKGEKGDKAEIDYGLVKDLVKTEVQKIDIKDGKDGLPGKDGANGVDGEKGNQGEPGSPGLEVELRTNPLNSNLEWRYIGDDSWQILLNTCGVVLCQ